MCHVPGGPSPLFCIQGPLLSAWARALPSLYPALCSGAGLGMDSGLLTWHPGAAHPAAAPATCTHPPPHPDPLPFPWDPHSLTSEQPQVGSC